MVLPLLAPLLLVLLAGGWSAGSLQLLGYSHCVGIIRLNG
jgi:hypothetical protein